jgi:hypothetical protein
MVGGTRVCDLICDGALVKHHGVERVGEGLLVPAPSPRVPCWFRQQLARLLHVPRVDRKWRLLPETPSTRPHLDRAGQGALAP